MLNAERSVNVKNFTLRFLRFQYSCTFWGRKNPWKNFYVFNDFFLLRIHHLGVFTSGGARREEKENVKSAGGPTDRRPDQACRNLNPS